MKYEVTFKCRIELAPKSVIDSSENQATADVSVVVDTENIGEPYVERAITHCETSLDYEQSETKIVEAEDIHTALELAFPGLDLNFSHSYLEETHFFEGKKECKYSINGITL